MSSVTLGRTLGASVAVVAVFNTMAALSLPVVARRPATSIVAVWLGLLTVHAAAYWFGERMRARFDLRGYAAAQALTLFAMVLARMPTPVAVGLLMTCTVEMVLLARGRSGGGTLAITAGAIALYVVAAAATSGLYFAATAGLLLAVSGALAHAVAALLPRFVPVVSRPAPTSSRPADAPAASLSAREVEVLAELVKGARNTEIAAALGISERTVKAHLASIYQKLGVESRSAAVALAVRRQLVPTQREG